MPHIVYSARNRVNGKLYIGYTSQGLKARKARHIYRASKGDSGCPRFYDAIRKHGSEAFDWNVEATFEDQSNALSYEIALIAQRLPRYNVAPGGSGGGGSSATSKPVLCLEDGILYDSMAAAAMANGVVVSDVSEVCAGNRITAGGKHFVLFTRDLTAEERNKLIVEREKHAVLCRKRRVPKGSRRLPTSTDVLGRSKAGPMKSARPVLCLDDGEVYISASAAAAFYDVSKSAVIELCLGRNGRKTVSGKRFVYVGDQL